jgi:hypothetical protein
VRHRRASAVCDRNGEVASTERGGTAFELDSGQVSTSRHAVNHGVDIHPRPDGGKHGNVSWAQPMVVQLVPLQKIVKGGQGCNRTVAEP